MTPSATGFMCWCGLQPDHPMNNDGDLRYRHAGPRFGVAERDAVLTRLTTPVGKAYFDLNRAIGIIEAADGRAAAADGPVNHVRDEMTDREWRDVYRALVRARKSLEGAER